MGSFVSVVIPTYRRPVQVQAAVRSALEQTWADLEVVVVSDGPDVETAAAMTGMGPRVRYLELDRQSGPAEARNVGVRASRGEWVTFLDDDDLMLPHKVERQMTLADAEAPHRMIACQTLCRHGERDDIWPVRPIAEGESLGDYLLRRPSLLGRPGVVSLQSLLVHRSLLEALPFSSHKDHEDWAWLLEAWHLLGARIVFVWEPLVVYAMATDLTSRSQRLNWRESVAWAKEFRPMMSGRAFCSFLATKAALKARRAGDWKGLCEIAMLVLRNKPGLLELAFLGGAFVVPTGLLHGAWKRSLRRSGNDEGRRLAVAGPVDMEVF